MNNQELAKLEHPFPSSLQKVNVIAMLLSASVNSTPAKGKTFSKIRRESWLKKRNLLTAVGK